MATDGDGAIVGLAEEAAKERLRVYNDQAEGGARQIFIDPNATIKRYMHAAAELIRQGKECASEGDTDRAYVMLLRFTIFYLERLPEHPNFKAAPEKKALTKECLAALDQVEELKKELLARFAVEEADRIVAERHALAEKQAAAIAAAEAQAAEEAEAAREAAERAEVLAAVDAADREEAEAAEAARARAARAAMTESSRTVRLPAATTTSSAYGYGMGECGECGECVDVSDGGGGGGASLIEQFMDFGDDNDRSGAVMRPPGATVPPAPSSALLRHGTTASQSAAYPSIAHHGVRSGTAYQVGSYQGQGGDRGRGYGEYEYTASANATSLGVPASLPAYSPGDVIVAPPPLVPPSGGRTSQPAPSHQQAAAAPQPMGRGGAQPVMAAPALPPYAPLSGLRAPPAQPQPSPIPPQPPQPPMGQPLPAASYALPQTPLATPPPQPVHAALAAPAAAAPPTQPTPPNRSLAGLSLSGGLDLPSERKVAPSPWAKKPSAAAGAIPSAGATPAAMAGATVTSAAAAAAAAAAATAIGAGAVGAGSAQVGAARRCAPPPAFAWAGGAAAPPVCSVPGAGASSSSSVGMGGGAPSGGVGLRALVLPAGLPAAFLGVAHANTARNVETCGILAGKIVKGELVCDRLLVPHQTGSSDTCTTTNEDEIWEYCTSNSLCTFGWVHTHPSQSCFLSSVDLHTQCGYQSVLDEAVAIVLSPHHSPATGCFRLCHPSPPGLAELQRCRKRGFHHEHQRNGANAGNGVYEHCAHVRWVPNAALAVVDMRSR